jgi:hypothetical protein
MLRSHAKPQHRVLKYLITYFTYSPGYGLTVFDQTGQGNEWPRLYLGRREAATVPEAIASLDESIAAYGWDPAAPVELRNWETRERTTLREGTLAI